MTSLFSDSFQDFENPLFNDYEVLHSLGSGGHSTVYLCRQKSGVLVAVKRWLNPNLSQSLRSRISLEVETLRTLKHPNIVQFRELIEDQTGRPCIVMDYIEGENFSELIKKESFTLEQLLDIAERIVEALIYLESQHLVHRDLKPANIMIRRSDKEAILVDFSIVKPGESNLERSELTKTGSSLGTAPYMAPEQCEGELGDAISIDHRTDIYGFGALLFHAATGYPPWTSESAWERLTRNPWTNPYPGHKTIRSEIKEKQRDFPAKFGHIIQKCLEGSPEKRFSSPTQLRDALKKMRRPAIPQRSLVLGLLLGAILVLVALSWKSFFQKRTEIDHQAPAKLPNNLQNKETKNLKDQDMLKEFLGATLVAPLIVMNAASQAQADLYETKTVKQCTTCSRIYSDGIDICAADQKALQLTKRKFVKDLGSYFPVRKGKRKIFQLKLSPIVITSEASKEMLVTDLEMFAKDSPKTRRIEVESSKRIGNRNYHCVSSRLSNCYFRIDQDRGVLTLNADKTESLLLPFPLSLNQEWDWEGGHYPYFEAVRMPARAKMIGFSELSILGDKRPCLTLRVVHKSRVHHTVHDFYFAKNLGLVKTVYALKGVGTRENEIIDDKAVVDPILKGDELQKLVKSYFECIEAGDPKLSRLIGEKIWSVSLVLEQKGKTKKRKIQDVEEMSRAEFLKECQKITEMLKGLKKKSSKFSTPKMKVLKKDRLHKVELESILGKDLAKNLNGPVYQVVMTDEKKTQRLEFYFTKQKKIVCIAKERRRKKR